MPIYNKKSAYIFAIRQYSAIFGLAILALALFTPTSTAAQDKSGVTPQVISLPSGPGSIEGMGESFEPQLNTGAASYSIKIAVPPGVKGHQPELAIQYNGGFGEGDFGLGWDLPLPGIRRQTDKGQPTYGDTDVFVYSNGEELVPLADGTWRCENESAFMRFKRDGDGWEIRDKGGKIYRLGQYPSDEFPNRASRIGNGSLSFDQTFKWHIDSVTDTNGNCIEYFYTTFEDSPGKLYVAEIRYNLNGDAYNSIAFDYEERPDSFTDYRPGFKIKTGRRAFRIRVLSQGAAIREYRICYEDDDNEIIDPSAEGSVPPAFSLLTKVVQLDGGGENYLPPIRFGYTRLHLKDQDNPPLGNFPGQEDVDLNGNGIEDGPGVHQMADAPQNLNFQDGTADFLDVNGDGLPDVIHTSDGNHYYYLNLGTDRFGQRQTMGNSPLVPLESSGTALSDMDGDGLTDMVNKASQDLMTLYRNTGKGSWEDGVAYNDAPMLFDMNDPDTRLFDADFDKKIDVVRSVGGGSWVFCYNRSNSVGGSWQCTGSVAVNLPAQIVFSNPSVHLADMNGDRLQDVVWIRKLSQSETVAWVWPYKGNAKFDAYQVMSGSVALGPTPVEDVKLADINGDGLSDMVIVATGSVTAWLNMGNGSWSSSRTFFGTPAYSRTDTSLRFADMNGNGTADLVWIKAVTGSENANEKFQYLDFSGQARPNQLKIIDNGLGRRIRIYYKSSTSYYTASREEGTPWNTRSPIPVDVVGKVVTTSGLELDGIEGADEYVTEYAYRDAFYDGFEREFRGFAFVKKIDRGGETAPTQVTRIFFHTGAPDGINNDGDVEVDERTETGGAEEEPLKGMILKQEVATAAGGADTTAGDGQEAGDDAVFSRALNSWAVRRLHNSDGGLRDIATMNEREVSFCYNQQEDNQIIELGSETAKQTRKAYVYDDFGNVAEEKNWGAVSIGGDEVFNYNEYIHDTENWIVDKPKRQYRTDADGNKVYETRYHYDGEPYAGLEYGMIQKGNLVREEGWVEEDTYINTIRNAHDDYGNIIGIKDGNGNLREIEYDAVFHAFPVKEIIHVGGSAPALAITAEYHTGFGVMTRSIDFNGHATAYGYDSFGRLVKIVKPDDSSEYPTQCFTYAPSDPVRGLVYTYDETGSLALVNKSAAPSAVTTKIRENFGEPGTFDAVQYTDGLGRKLALVEEAEQGFVVKEASLFNAKGTAKYTFLPYDAETSDYQPPFLSKAKTETHCDATGREVLRINPPDKDGTVTQAGTKYFPLKSEVTDENGNSKIIISDGLERLIEVHENNREEVYITRYTYDPLGNLTKITDAQNNIKTMIFDGLNRKTEMNDPDSGQKFYDYDDTGNLIQTTDNKGQIVQYTYDGANRILTEYCLDEADISPDVVFHYDAPSNDWPDAENAKGSLSWIEDLSGALFFSYDRRGNTSWQVKRIHQDNAFQDFRTAFAYDAMDRVASTTYPDGDQLSYTYNNRSLLEAIPGIVTAMNYYASGQIASIDYANGVSTDYCYDPRQRLSGLNTLSALQSNNTVQNLGYTMDGVGNITEIKDLRAIPNDSPQNATQTFQYDDLYRLTYANGPGYGAINFQYDKIGNMTFKQSPDAPDQTHIDDELINLGSMHYGGTGGSSNRTGRTPGDPPGPHAATGTQSGLVYDYDDNGNMVGHATGDIYSWDFRDRLIRVQKGETDTHYVYDHGGQRIIKKVKDGNREKTTLYVSNDYEIREGKIIKHVFAGNRRVARIEGNLSSRDNPTCQTLSFQPGWNFFSLTVEPENSAIDDVLHTFNTPKFIFPCIFQPYNKSAFIRSLG